MDVKEIKKWYIAQKKLYFASMELTQNCNFKCKHCYCADKNSPTLTLAQAMHIIDQLHQTGCLFLNFTGGEIFTHPQFKDIYRYAKEKGFIIDLLTNISLLNDELITLFREYPPFSIAVTLYGTNEEDYLNFTGNAVHFHQTMRALDLLKENDISFVLRTVATQTLCNSVANGSFETLAADRFSTTWKYDPIVFPKTTGDQAPLSESLTAAQIVDLELHTPAKKRGWETAIAQNKPFHWTCQGGVCSMAIDFQGNAFICGLYRKHPISLLTHDIKSVQKHLAAIHEAHIEIMQNSECSRCDKRNFCKWCPAYALIYNQNETQKIDFFCELAQKRLETFQKGETNG